MLSIIIANQISRLNFFSQEKVPKVVVEIYFFVCYTNLSVLFKGSDILFPFKEIAHLDKMIHEPARLAIMTALDACTLAEFLFLQELTGLTKGNLSSHLSKLEKAGYVSIDKHFVRQKIPHTTIRITREGRAAISKYWQKIDGIRQKTKGWNKKNS